jgi:short-subunit dehydrogenase
MSAAPVTKEPVALVTGASSGIGRETVLAFAGQGARVVAVARREERLRELARCSDRIEALAGDLGERGFAEEAVRQTLARYGRLDVLVNNAAMPKHKPIQEIDPDEVERVLRVNFLACVWTTLAALPAMLAQEAGGAIVNVSSFAAHVVPPRESIYAASKRALEGFTEGLWSDLAHTEVHAALVVPGAIDTEIWSKLDEPAAFRGRRHPPRLVADAILEAVAHRRHMIIVPKRSPPLVAARWLHFLAPGLMRRALRRMDPVTTRSRTGP